MLLSGERLFRFILLLFFLDGLIARNDVGESSVMDKRGLIDSFVQKFKKLMTFETLIENQNNLKPAKFGYRCLWKICSRPLNDRRKLKYYKPENKITIYINGVPHEFIVENV